MQSRLSHVRRILFNIEFRDWGFDLYPARIPDKNTLILQVSFPVVDCNTNIVSLQTGRKWLISEHATDSEIVQTVFKAIITALEHESREDFLYKNRRILGPHLDLDKLVDFCDSVPDKERD